VAYARGLEDRFLAGAALLAAGRESPRATEALASLKADEARRLRFLAGAATPDPASKARYFADYGNADTPPEQWAQDSLPYFHWRGQDALTLPFLRAALERLEWVKQKRKIFFLAAWIDSFVNAHSSAEALAVVDGFLRERGQGMAPDVAKKLAQSRDGLARAVAIRARW
jgi:aminopeptidase N